MSIGAFASSGEEVKIVQDKQVVAWACCSVTESVGEPGQAGYLSITIKKCIDDPNSSFSVVHAAACNNAQIAAKNAIRELAPKTVVLVPVGGGQ